VSICFSRFSPTGSIPGTATAHVRSGLERKECGRTRDSRGQSDSVCSSLPNTLEIQKVQTLVISKNHSIAQ